MKYTVVEINKYEIDAAAPDEIQSGEWLRNGKRVSSRACVISGLDEVLWLPPRSPICENCIKSGTYLKEKYPNKWKVACAAAFQEGCEFGENG